MTVIEDVLKAFEDYAEASAKLREAQSEYTGYSPSYHLASWYGAKEKATNRAKDALNEFILQAVKEATERERG